MSSSESSSVAPRETDRGGSQGRRAPGGGRPKKYVKTRQERDVRIWMRRADHDKWNALKLRAGKKADAEFIRYLLDLADRATDTR